MPFTGLLKALVLRPTLARLQSVQTLIPCRPLPKIPCPLLTCPLPFCSSPLPSWDDWQGLVGNSIYYNYEMSSAPPLCQPRAAHPAMLRLF